MQKFRRYGLLRGISHHLSGNLAAAAPQCHSPACATKLSLTTFAIAACLTVQPDSSLAADYTWDTGGAGIVQGGAGDWNNGDNNWTTDNGASNTNWLDGSTAIFGGTSGIISLGGTQEMGVLVFNSDGYTISSNGVGGPDRLTWGSRLI